MKNRFCAALFALSFLFTLCFFIPSALALDIDDFSVEGEARSSISGVAASTILISSGAIGGNRQLYSYKSAAGAGSTILETFSDPVFLGDVNFSLGYTQGAHPGQGIVTWDGDSSVTQTTHNGLSATGVDFTQDGGTSLQLGVKFFDFPNLAPLDITLRLYDAYGIGALKYSDVKLSLDRALTPVQTLTLSIPFSLFVNTGPSTVTDSDSGTFTSNTSFGPGGAVDLTKVGAISLIINGLNNSFAPDFVLDFINTNGICRAVPDTEGKVIDACGICKGDAGYMLPKDDCGLCPNDPLYNKAKDDCGLCPSAPNYKNAKDDCGLCPSDPTYTRAKDPCGVCFGDGSSCADCAGSPNGTAKLDICNVCNGNGTTCLDCAGNPNGSAVIDACNICGGGITDPTLCNVDKKCATVEASAEILKFEERLVKQATTITKKFKEENSRNKRNQCKINTKPSEKRVNESLKTIKDAGKDIFTKGVEICGDNCVTVSFADQVTALIPTLKIIESETKSLAKKVQKCYQKKKIKTTQNINGVQTTIKNVTSDLTQLLKDCKDKQVCPK